MRLPLTVSTMTVWLLFYGMSISLADESLREQLGELAAIQPAERAPAAQALADKIRKGAGEFKRSDLLPLVNDKDPAIRFAAAETMGYFDPLESLEVAALLALFPDEERNKYSEMVCLSAARSLGSRNPAPLKEIVAQLESTEPARRRSGLIAADFVGREQAGKILDRISPLLDDEHPVIRRMALGVLRTVGPPAAKLKHRVTPFLRDEDFHTQYWAARALGAMGELAASEAPELIYALQHGRASVRGNAALALGDIGPKAGREALAALEKALGDPFVTVRERAAKALGQFGEAGRPAAGALAEALKSSATEVRVEAARALAALGMHQEAAVRALMEELDQNNLPWTAAEALALFGDQAKPAVDKLIETLSAPDPETRAAAAKTLGVLGDSKARERLKQVAEADSEVWVREKAAKALQALPEEAKSPAAKEKPTQP